MSQMGNTQEIKQLQVVDVRRNPYLAEYDVKRQVRRSATAVRRETMESRSQGRRRRNAQRRRRRLCVLMLGLAVCALLLGIGGRLLLEGNRGLGEESGLPPVDGAVAVVKDLFIGERIQGLRASVFSKHPTWIEDFLTPNEYSRPGDSLKEVKNIFVHYTANPGTNAAQNRSYFEQLKDTHERSASAHFIIGYEGEIVQCIPLDEIAYAVVGRNQDSISIECCYLAEDGSFTEETYASLLKMLKWLTSAYHLKEEDILRHYDCGGKKCPLYYTEHEDAWEQLKRDVKDL